MLVQGQQTRGSVIIYLFHQAAEHDDLEGSTYPDWISSNRIMKIIVREVFKIKP